MTSSISGSDPAAWRRFVGTFLLAGAGLLAATLAAELVIDPYDRGVLGGPVRGVADFGSRFSDASRARDPAFSGAILGNSHIQLIDPARLSSGSGIDFVSLAISGTGPREQMAVLDAFLRHHAGSAQALVIGVDGPWCTEDPTLPLAHPFPFWLYDPSPKAVLDGLMRYSTVEHAGRALSERLGQSERARPDGYWNYAREWVRRDGDPAALDAAGDPLPPNATRRFPAFDRLASRLAGLPPDVAVILVRPPVYVLSLAEDGTATADREANCLAATRGLAALHPMTRVLDLRSALPESRDAGSWFDQSHYKEPVARKLEAAIGDALRELVPSASARPSP